MSDMRAVDIPSKTEKQYMVDYLPRQQTVPSSNLGLTTIFPFFSIRRKFQYQNSRYMCVYMCVYVFVVWQLLTITTLLFDPVDHLSESHIQ